jgi:hypothetical protein
MCLMCTSAHLCFAFDEQMDNAKLWNVSPRHKVCDGLRERMAIRLFKVRKALLGSALARIAAGSAKKADYGLRGRWRSSRRRT